MAIASIKNGIDQLTFEDGVLSYDGHQRTFSTVNDIKDVVSAIREAPACKLLILRGNRIGQEASKALSEALAARLDLKGAIFGDIFKDCNPKEVGPAMGHIMEGIRFSGASLIELDFNGSGIGGENIAHLASYLASNASLEVLRLSDNNLGSNGCMTVGNSLLRLSESKRLHLRILEMNRNNLGSKAAVHSIASLLSKATAMEEISLYENDLGTLGLEALAAAFHLLPNLRVINLGANYCAPECAKKIGSSLAALHRLKILNLNHCRMQDSGTEAVAKALANCPNIREVHFRGNELTEAGGTEVLYLLKNCQKLSLIDLDQNRFGPQGVKMIRCTARANNQFRYLLPLDNDEGEESDAGVEINKAATKLFGQVGRMADEEFNVYMNTLYYTPTDSDIAKLLDEELTSRIVNLFDGYQFPKRIARTIVSIGSVAYNLQCEELKRACVIFCEVLLHLGLNNNYGENRFAKVLMAELRVLPYDGFVPQADVTGAFWLMECIVENNTLPESLLQFMYDRMAEMESALADGPRRNFLKTLSKALNDR